MNATANLSGPYTSLDQLMHRRHAAAALQVLWKTPARSVIEAGTSRSKFRGRGMEFAEVRAYEPGDDIRTIDWRVTARKGRLHTKLFQEERERPMLVLVDQTASMFFGSKVRFKSVAAADAAALLAWAALNNGDRVGGMVVGTRDCDAIRPKRSRNAVLQLLRALDERNRQLCRPQAQAQDIDFATSFTRLRQIRCTGGQLFVISDFRCLLKPQSRRLVAEQLYILRRHNQISLIMVHDPLERHLPANGQYRVTNGKIDLAVDAANSMIQRGYRDFFENRCKILQELCHQQGLKLSFLETTAVTVKALLNPQPII